MRTFRTIGIASIAVLLFSATTVFAEEQSASVVDRTNESERNPSGINRPTTASTTRGEIREATKDRMEKQREEIKGRMEDTREKAKNRIEATREEIKARMEKQREEVKTRMEATREEAKARMEKQREKTTERLSHIQDKKKQQMAERLSEQFEKINEKWTDRFMERLDRYDDILKKIQDRATIALGVGKDVTATTLAIQSAKTTIASARTAVIAQAAKTYTLDPLTIPVTTATTTPNGQSELTKSLRTSFQNLHKILFKDLFTLRDGLMTDARKAVQNAHQALSKIRGVDEGNATSTAATSNQ